MRRLKILRLKISTQLSIFSSLPATTVTCFELCQQMKQDIQDCDGVLADDVEIRSLFPYSGSLGLSELMRYFHRVFFVFVLLMAVVQVYIR